MTIETIPSELNPDEQMIFDRDLRELQTTEKQYGMKDGAFAGRTKFGLDPVRKAYIVDTRCLQFCIQLFNAYTDTIIFPPVGLDGGAGVVGKTARAKTSEWKRAAPAHQ